MIPPAPDRASPTPDRSPRPHRWLTLAYRFGVASTLGLIALGVIGQVVRDRSAVWGLLMYLPLPVLGLGAVVLDLLARGRSGLGRRRFVLTALGLVVALESSLRLVAWGPETSTPARVVPADRTSPDPGLGTVKLLHWNVIWGGGRRRDSSRWVAIRRAIAAQTADLIVLSEAPPDDWLDELTSDLGPLGNRVQVENGPGEAYWYKLVVASAWPVRLVRREVVRGGAAMVVEVTVRPGLRGVADEVVRLLVVDGQSRPTQWRTPFLHDLAAACDRAETLGAPIDLVVGDFNSVSASLGFEALAARGFALASRATPGQWRGTFPSRLPLYDIDHVWIAPRLASGLASRLFTEFASDHRGQVVTLCCPGSPSGP